MEISKIVKEPKSKTLEFKRDLSSLQPVLKTIVAFANTAGGTLIVGRASDGEICGVEDPFADEEKLSNAIADNIVPSIFPEIEIATVGGKDLLVVQVAHWKGPVYLKRKGIPGGVYIRLGSTSRPVNADTLAELERQAVNGSYDLEPIHGLTEADLDLDRARELFAKQGKEFDGHKLESCNLVARVNHHTVPTVGGLILFGRENDRMRYVPDARISCARFLGVDKTHILDRYEERGTILEMIDPALKFIARNTRLGAEITATRRIDIPEYPPLAVREALVNAVVHADYTIKGSHTRVAIFDDRLEIMNSGMLPFGYTLDDLPKGVSRVRNRVIVRLFHELDLMEEWGSGYRRIHSECDEKGYPYPKWEEGGTWTQVTFYPHPKTVLDQTADGLSARQEKLLEIIREHGPISSPEIAEWMDEGVSTRTLNRELAALRDLGRIMSTGKGRAMRWAIK